MSDGFNLLINIDTVSMCGKRGQIPLLTSHDPVRGRESRGLFSSNDVKVVKVRVPFTVHRLTQTSQ